MMMTLVATFLLALNLRAHTMGIGRFRFCETTSQAHGLSKHSTTEYHQSNSHRALFIDTSEN